MPASPCCSSTSTRDRVAQLNAGESYIEDVPTEILKPFVESGLIAATTDYDELRDADAILVALPTPLSRQREPDLRILESAVGQIATRLRPGHLVVLESTTYPGTTRERVQPILERGSGLTAGKDFHLAFSPERVDPGREDWTTTTVPKVVGGIDEGSTAAAVALYGSRDRHGPSRLVARGRGADEAPREHLPLGQHRARQRARAALRPNGHRRLGGHRGRRDEAVRLHVVQAGAGSRRSLHPDRSLLPHLEGARVRLLHRVHRARREGQRVDAVLLPLARLPGAEPRSPALALRLEDPRARRRVQARHRGHPRVARGQAHRAPRERRSGRRLPRPPRSVVRRERALDAARRRSSPPGTTASSS